MAELHELLIESVFPILQKDEYERFHIAGSSVFIEYRQAYYLVTASHVLSAKYPLYISLDKETILLDRGLVRAEEDDIDLAILDLALDKDISMALSAHKPLSINEDDKIDHYSRIQYLAFGFPATKFSHNKNGNIFDYKDVLSFISKESCDQIYDEIGRNKRLHTVIDYVKNNQKRHDGTSLIGVDPFGASGGGLFKLFVDENDHLILYSLDGILIEWKKKKAIVATRLPVLRGFIDWYLINKPPI